jgi:hypothetical protein
METYQITILCNNALNLVYTLDKYYIHTYIIHTHKHRHKLTYTLTCMYQNSSQPVRLDAYYYLKTYIDIDIKNKCKGFPCILLI